MSDVSERFQNVIHEVWSSIVGSSLEVANHDAEPSGEPSVAATVPFLGDWRGAVVLRVPEPLARQVGAAMFMMDAADVSAADVHDAVGEICNMIGGNIRADLSPTCELGTPTIVTGTHFVVTLPDTEELANAKYAANDLPLRVTLLKRRSA